MQSCEFDVLVQNNLFSAGDKTPFAKHRTIDTEIKAKRDNIISELIFPQNYESESESERNWRGGGRWNSP